MANLNELTIDGIKCDNPECDWSDKSVKSEAEMSLFLNKPCPKCGQNVLTDDDWERFLLVIKVWEEIENLSEDEIKQVCEEMILIPEDIDVDATYEVKLNTHKNVTIESIKKVNNDQP